VKGGVTDHKADTADWIRRAGRQERPYGVLPKRDHGLTVLGVIKDQTLSIGDRILAEGHTWWRVVNESVRVRRVDFTAQALEGRIEWDVADAIAGPGGAYVRVSGVVQRTTPQAEHFAERDWSAGFGVSRTGAEAIRTTWGGEFFDCLFDAVADGPGSSAGKTAKGPDAEATASPSMAGRSVDVAVVTALPEEYAAVLECLDEHEPDQAREDDPNLFAWERGEVKSLAGRTYSVVVGLTAHAGSLFGADAVKEAAQRYDARYVLVVGVAGAIVREDEPPDKRLALGDVVFSSVIHGYEYGKLERQFHPRDDLTYRVDMPLVRAAHRLAMEEGASWAAGVPEGSPGDGRKVKAVEGEAASGDKVVDDVSTDFMRQVMKHWPKLRCIEMEGTGAAFGIQSAQERGLRTGFMMVRGISDIPRGQPGADAMTSGRQQSQTAQRDEWKPFAARMAAAFACELIRSHWPVTPREDQSAG